MFISVEMVDFFMIGYEIVMLLYDIKNIFVFQLVIFKFDWEVENYKEIFLDLEFYEFQMEFVFIIYFSIIMLVFIFGIINMMLMVVLECI